MRCAAGGASTRQKGNVMDDWVDIEAPEHRGSVQYDIERRQWRLTVNVVDSED